MILQMIRGDTWGFSVAVKDIPFGPGDTLTFTVKGNPAAKPYVLQKIVTDFNTAGRAVFVVEAGETSSLPFGTYKYDVEWRRADGTVRTILGVADFILQPEVTW